MKTLINVLVGNILYALTVKLFLLPSHLITGGTTGIGLFLNHYLNCDLSLFILIFNVMMLMLGWAILGKKFALTTIVSTFTYPIALKVFDILLKDIVLTNDIFLCTIFTGIGIGFSLGIVIRSGASTGGMDIPPLILNHYFKLPVSLTMYAFDFMILLLQCTFNKAESILYGIILIMVYTFVLDQFMIQGSSKTELNVVSNKSNEIRSMILKHMDRGATILNANGGYTDKEIHFIFSIISNRELPRMLRKIHEIDPEAFIVIKRVKEVEGKGFTLKKEYINGEKYEIK